MKHYHTPVLLQEVLQALNIQKDATYIDATLGGGGHTFEIVKRGGRVLGIDVDEDALKHVEDELRIKNYELGKEITIVRGNFREIDTVVKEHGFENTAGILFDLGVSSFQLDKAEKGFSFMYSGPLDMRMDTTLKVSAGDLVNGLTRGELYELFTRLERREMQNG
jgi:16S rRNA (cytosine1402-N4)-methyltransferase